jgi:hypothetical protein
MIWHMSIALSCRRRPRPYCDLANSGPRRCRMTGVVFFLVVFGVTLLNYLVGRRQEAV